MYTYQAIQFDDSANNLKVLFAGYADTIGELHKKLRRLAATWNRSEDTYQPDYKFVRVEFPGHGTADYVRSDRINMHDRRSTLAKTDEHHRWVWEEDGYSGAEQLIDGKALKDQISPADSGSMSARVRFTRNQIDALELAFEAGDTEAIKHNASQAIRTLTKILEEA